MLLRSSQQRQLKLASSSLAISIFIYLLILNSSTLNAILTIKVHESDELVVASEVVGWIYFAAWTVSFYPQIFENWKRKR